jgi:hypothetical protein
LTLTPAAARLTLTPAAARLTLTPTALLKPVVCRSREGMNFNFYWDKSATKGRMSAGLKVYKKNLCP